MKDKKDSFTSVNVFDYPEAPKEEKGIYICEECGRTIYSGEDVVRTWDDNSIICEDCVKDMMPYEIYELAGQDYDAKILYRLLGGKWEEVLEG